MTMTASLSLHQPGAVSAGQSDVQQMLAAGRLPDAPLTMPTQRLEQKRTTFAFVKALFDGPLRPAGT